MRSERVAVITYQFIHYLQSLVKEFQLYALLFLENNFYEVPGGYDV